MRIIIILFLLFLLACQEDFDYCMNPEIIAPENTRLIIREDYGSNCGYNHLFLVYYGDMPVEGLLLTDNDHGFPPLHLGYYDPNNEKLIEK
jgi:hypothetical protein